MERPLKNLSAQEWESLIEDFRQVGSYPVRWTSHFSSFFALLEVSFSTLFRKDFPLNLKLHLLIFLDEFAETLFFDSDADQLLSKLIESLRILIQSPSDGVSITYALKEQMMVSATSITLTMNSLRGVVHVPQLEGLVTILLTIINRPNHGIDRNSRAVACECLRELEREYPCLLGEIVGQLWALCQSERTHSSQSYLLLLLEVIHHIIVCKLNVPSIVGTSIPLFPFTVPQWLRNGIIGVNKGDELGVGMNVGGEELSALNLRELRRVMAFLLEWPQVLTPCGMMEFMSTVMPVAAALELQPSLLKVQFSGLMYSFDPLLSHVVLMMYSQFPDAFDGQEGEIARRLMLISKEGQPLLVFRLLALHWLLGFIGLVMGRDATKRQLIIGMVFSFYPNVFDALALKSLKLDLLAFCSIYVGSDRLESVGGEFQEGDSALSAVKYFEDGLVSVSSFKWLPPWSTETSVAFRTFHKFLIGVSSHSDTDSSTSKVLVESTIFLTIQRMLVSLVLDFQKLVPVVVALIDRLLCCQKHCWLGENLLRIFDQCLLPKVVINYKLTSYFPIFDRIGKNDTIPPRQLLELLMKFMIFLVEKHGPDTGLKYWSQGSRVLGICRAMMMHHHSSRLFTGLSHLLAFTCLYFPDLEVRDNARIYLRMLLCIPGKKLRCILNLGEQLVSISPSPYASSFLNVQSPRFSEDTGKSKSISSYVHLDRVVPLLVKQSWSLSLQTLGYVDDKYGYNGGTSDSKPPANGKESDDIMYTSEARNIDLPQEPLRVMDSKVSEILVKLRRHFSCIPDFRYMDGIKIEISCTLRFESEPFEGIWGVNLPDGLPAMYATVLSFSSSAPYGAIPSYHIPFLLGEPATNHNLSCRRDSWEIVPAENGSTGKESFNAPLSIELEPREPVPGLVDVLINANAENGQIIHGQLLSISVGIEDMFLKAILPPDISGDAAPDYCSDLFDALWEACGASSYTGREMFLLKGGKGTAAICGTQSVKLLEVPATRIISGIERYLAPFVVSVIGEPLVGIVKDGGILGDVTWKDAWPDTALDYGISSVDESDGGPLYLTYFSGEDDKDGHSKPYKTNMGCFLVLIFLPPRYHLLFRMEVSDVSTLVRIRTDHWPCLAYVDDYLEALFSS
ncbi:hypothetical protein Nepgr_000733 [Nepenthes gracilis]|uniref:Adaptor-related protein complex 5 beta subunit n=1 Tax=Nepenthes gracilis TaxID=150966 RepID=A0AAD3RWF0_NEPGR|nr:hypothetical protein Nepgr_000733 [Nepenthes gracilis]